MLIFNTTLHVDDSVHDECLEYLKENYIPCAVSDGLLTEPALARIDSLHEVSGISYAVQFKTLNKNTLNKWAENTGSKLQRELGDKFGNKVSGFSTILEEIPLRKKNE